jgi:hypothetical protein
LVEYKSTLWRNLGKYGIKALGSVLLMLLDPKRLIIDINMLLTAMCTPKSFLWAHVQLPTDAGVAKAIERGRHVYDSIVILRPHKNVILKYLAT